MDKIYSRKRFIIPYIARDNSVKSKNIKTIKTICILIISVCIANRVLNSVEPVINSMSREIAKSTATRISNEQASVVMLSYKYEDICNITKDEHGNIKMIQMNYVVVNDISSNIALKIQEQFDNYHRGDFTIKMGNFTGTKILSGRGPDIPIKMIMAGNVETELVSKFSQAGINQTLHGIYLNVKCTVSIITPYDIIEETITNQVMLAEAVIVGEIPDTYYNLNGVKDEDLIKIVE